MRHVWLCIFLLPAGFNAEAQSTDLLRQIHDLRLWGDLTRAQLLAEQQLAAGTPDPGAEVHLRLELARIHDRRGLHFNRRPVAAAMSQVDSAAAMGDRAGPAARAAIELLRGDLLYRAESAASGFPLASTHARQAAESFRRLGDAHGEAEATHLLGLIHLQRGELRMARALFDQSLEQDRAAGERLFFRGEYERHIGFVALLEGDTTAAIPHLERSLVLRREVRARDASLFAASTLASVLIGQGHLDAARRHLLYATTVALGLDAPFARAQLALIAGNLHAGAGEPDEARLAFETAVEIAESVGATGIATQARNGIRVLGMDR